MAFSLSKSFSMKSQHVSNDPQEGSTSEKTNGVEMQEHPVMAVKPKTDVDENPDALNTEETNDEDAEELAETAEDDDLEDQEEVESDKDKNENK